MRRDRQRAVAVRQRHVAGFVLEIWRSEQLGGRDLVENAIGFAEIGFGGDAGQDTTVDAARDDDMAAARKAPRRNEIGHQGLQLFDIGEARLPRGRKTVDTLGKHVSQRHQVALVGRTLLPVLVDHLNESAEADGN